MSAILSADDLNDFISPGVACIKPIETLPAQSETPINPYEVTTEDQVAASVPPPPAQISLTDCLACSGCVTSAEAVLVTLQSHTEVLSTLDAHPSLRAPWDARNDTQNGTSNGMNGHDESEGKLFVASVSPQARASLAAVFSISEAEAGNMIAQLLSGDLGLRNGGAHGSDFTWVIDTNVTREACLVAAADEVTNALSPEASKSPSEPGSEGAIDTTPKKPILTSACPGWICYAEKTHPYILPYISRLKSPQALTGTLIKSVLSRRYNIPPSQVWHVAIMPCFDKKLEASRSELTSSAWSDDNDASSQDPVRDVDCVITARELLQLASARGINFASLPRSALTESQRTPFPDPKLDTFLFPPARRANQNPVAGSSGGYLYHILRTYQARHPGSSITVSRGRNADVVEYSLVQGSTTIFKTARYYGFRNIQNLVRALKPAKISRLTGAKPGGVSRRPPGRGGAGGGPTDIKEYAYVEVMACPGGCTNGGGQVKVSEVQDVRVAEGLVSAEEAAAAPATKPGPKEQKAWLARVDEAYYSGSEDDSVDGDGDYKMQDSGVENGANGVVVQEDVVNGISKRYIGDVMGHWSEITGVDTQTLLYTSYRKVESDVGKKQNDVERVVALSSSVGGGW
ncbi:iron hydrogenase [Periconia macrospinosa]|uniref:Nuclear architecture-related protein 1 n=1 Tax=Periconia macrospinosa TaxID=97972 RepID=A0A2V1DVB9_9PLEO|nr:iron hydrogenase [Periconia macrospinosa]